MGRVGVDERNAYRHWLLEAYQAQSAAFDRAVMTISSGALAISLVFVHDVAPKNPSDRWALLTSWILFASSLLVVAASMVASQVGIRKMIDRVDRDEADDAYSSAERMTSVLNGLGGILLLTGVGCLLYFAWNNA